MGERDRKRDRKQVGGRGRLKVRQKEGRGYGCGIFLWRIMASLSSLLYCSLKGT